MFDFVCFYFLVLFYFYIYYGMVRSELGGQYEWTSKEHELQMARKCVDQLLLLEKSSCGCLKSGKVYRIKKKQIIAYGAKEMRDQQLFCCIH